MFEARPSRARRRDQRLASVSGPACGRSLGRGGLAGPPARQPRWGALAERQIDVGDGRLDRSENGCSWQFLPSGRSRAARTAQPARLFLQIDFSMLCRSACTPVARSSNDRGARARRSLFSRSFSRQAAETPGSRQTRDPSASLQPSDRGGVRDLDSAVHRLPPQNAPGTNGRGRNLAIPDLAGR